MPREDRRIIFDMNETYQALYKLTLKQEDSGRLIPGVIEKIDIDPTDENKINFTIKNPREGHEKTATFSRDFVAAALMMFCRGCGIPLPRRAKKSVMFEKGQVMLRVMV
jgi:hypothetical protein